MAIVPMITVGNVRDRMVLPDAAANAPALQSAINGAYLRVEAELDTKLERINGNVDVFLLDKSKCGYVIPDNVFRLRLRRSFVKTAGFAILRSDSLDFTDAEALTAADFKVNYESGYVFVNKEYENDYLQVSYDSGFDTAADAPDWLKEAILTYVPVIFLMNQPSKKKSENLPNVTASANHAMRMLEPGKRTMGFAISPVYL